MLYYIPTCLTWKRFPATLLLPRFKSSMWRNTIFNETHFSCAHHHPWALNPRESTGKISLPRREETPRSNKSCCWCTRNGFRLAKVAASKKGSSSSCLTIKSGRKTARNWGHLWPPSGPGRPVEIEEVEFERAQLGIAQNSSITTTKHNNSQRRSSSSSEKRLSQSLCFSKSGWSPGLGTGIRVKFFF